MPVKILLADKSITIQKVVEMLFSGKEYEVTCASDGESALSEASRIVPDVVLADVDLPRLDGYGFAARMKQTAALSQTPVVLMMSRDDQYDATRGGDAGIVDHIAKPFESQELIGKVKKALSTAVSRPAAALPKKLAPAAPVQPAPKPAPLPPRPAEAAPAAPSKPKAAVPSDMFGIIEEAPARAAAGPSPTPPAKAAPPPPAQEEVFEVEPEIEVEPVVEESAAPVPPAAQTERQPSVPSAMDAFDTETLFGKGPTSPAPPVTSSAGMEVEAEIVPEAPPSSPAFQKASPLPAEVEQALPVGRKAVDEMRAGLGLEEQPQPEPQASETFKEAPLQSDFVSFESLDMASRVSHEEYSYATPTAEDVRKGAPSPPAETPPRAPSLAQPAVSEEMVQAMSQELVAKIAREVLERVAWEVIPDLAERLIREEIERLKAGS